MRRILDSLVHEHRAGSDGIPLLLQELTALTLGNSPKVLISGCLAGQKVTYRGGSSEQRPSNPIHFIKNVLGAPQPSAPPILYLVPYCPEVELLGLPVPRPPIRLWDKDRKLIQADTLRPLDVDWSQRNMSLLSARLVCKDCKGFILKSKSPSCGVGDARVYHLPTGGDYELADGFFVKEVIMDELGTGANVVTERSIKDDVRLVDFLERVFS